MRTMDTLYGIISMTRSEQQLPRVSLEDLDITDGIQTLRGVADGTDINAMYNPRKQSYQGDRALRSRQYGRGTNDAVASHVRHTLLDVTCRNSCACRVRLIG